MQQGYLNQALRPSRLADQWNEKWPEVFQRMSRPSCKTNPKDICRDECFSYQDEDKAGNELAFSHFGPSMRENGKRLRELLNKVTYDQAKNIERIVAQTSEKIFT